MNWIILLLAGLFEVSLTFCLGKTRAASGVEFYLWGSGFLASTVLSMALLAKAVQTLPLGTAYAIWTGIGAVGTVLIGIFVFKEPATPIRLFFLFTLIRYRAFRCQLLLQPAFVGQHGKGFWGKRLFCQHGSDIDPDRLCDRTCICHPTG